jgi:hypothetical protein
MSRTATPLIVGRDEELGAIEAFLADTADGPAALVLSGEPGIGKTVLWEAAVRDAQERFGRVLLHRSVEAEALLSFSGLSDLLAAVFDEVAPALAPLRRRALEVALLLADPGDEAPDPRALGLALLDVLRAAPSLSPSTTFSGSTRRPPVSCRSRCDGCATSESACWPPCASSPASPPRSRSRRPSRKSACGPSGSVHSAWVSPIAS